MENKKVAITGGAGFIGSNLAEALCCHNEVTVIDDLSTGSMDNIKELVDQGKVELVEGSITDLPLLRGVFRGADFVLHQAAIPSVPRSVLDPIRTNEAGITGTLFVLVAARDCNVGKVVFASSSSVYGETPTLPKHEEMEPKPMSPYALTKLTGEHYCRLFTELYGLRTVALRYFNVYGPRQDLRGEYAAVIPKFIDCALNGRPMPIFGDGLQTRDFSYIKDVVRANIMAAESDATGVYNIAGGRKTSIVELAKIVSEIVGTETRIQFLEPRPGDIRDSWADISKAKRDLGFEPVYSLREGLRETVKWFKGKMGA